MAVNVFKDTSFNKVHSDWWDGSETPKQLADNVQALIVDKEKLGAKEIVLESDSGTWYTYLAAREDAKRGWYSSDGTKKA